MGNNCAPYVNRIYSVLIPFYIELPWLFQTGLPMTF